MGRSGANFAAYGRGIRTGQRWIMVSLCSSPFSSSSHGDRLIDGELAGLDAGDLALESGRDHDLVEDGGGLLHGADDVAADDLRALFHDGVKLPFLLAVQRRDLDAAGDGGARHVADLGQRALDAVIDVLQHAGSQLHGQGHSRRLDLGAGAEAGGLLIDLDGGAVARHVQDLADQALLADTHNVGDVGVGQTVRHDQRSGYFCDSTAQCSYFLS